VVAYVDSTVALPILTAYALSKHAERPLKRLYAKRDSLLADLKAAHSAHLAAEAADERG
jgi:deoxyhypusine synthase